MPDTPNYRMHKPYEEYDEDDEYQITQQRQPERPLPSHRRRRPRRLVSNILIGCLGGLITVVVIVAIIGYILVTKTPIGKNIGKSDYTQQKTQPLALSSATLLLVENPLGSVSINIDPKATGATLISAKKASAGSQSEANGLFSQIVLTTKRINRVDAPSCVANTCLQVTATAPQGNSASLDLTITLPSSFSDPVRPYTVAVGTMTGDISVNGFNGILNLSGSRGNVNISVTHSIVFPGTCLQTTDGNITVGQGSIFDLSQSPQLTPCFTTPSSNSDPWFHISSGHGNIDVNLIHSLNQLWRHVEITRRIQLRIDHFVDSFHLRER